MPEERSCEERDGKEEDRQRERDSRRELVYEARHHLTPSETALEIVVSCGCLSVGRGISSPPILFWRHAPGSPVANRSAAGKRGSSTPSTNLFSSAVDAPVARLRTYGIFEYLRKAAAPSASTQAHLAVSRSTEPPITCMSER
jgi:hypothetical protein